MIEHKTDHGIDTHGIDFILPCSSPGPGPEVGKVSFIRAAGGSGGARRDDVGVAVLPGVAVVITVVSVVAVV